MSDTFRVIRKLKSIKAEQGKLFYIPLIIIYILIPANTYFAYKVKYDVDDSASAMITYSQYFIPVLAIWWILFCFSKYVDSDGNELFFVGNKIKIKDAILLYILYEIGFSIPFIVYGFVFDNMALEWIKLTIQAFFFAAMSYFLIFLIKNIAGTMAILICYGFASSLLYDFIPHRFLISYMGRISTDIITTKYTLFIFIGIIALIAGYFLNKRMSKYK